MGRSDNLGKPGRTRRSPRWRGPCWWTPCRAAAALLVLAGCSSLPDAVNPIEWYRGATGLSANDPKPDERNTQNLEAGSERPAPNLASVPAPPTRAMSSAERERLAASLAADRANAHYTDEQLRYGNGAPAARPPTPPASPSAAAKAPGSPSPSSPSPSAQSPSSSPTPSAPNPAPAPSAGLVAGGALSPGGRGSVEREAPPQEAPATSPEVRSVPEPETPRAPPPPPRVAEPKAPPAPAVASRGPAAPAGRPAVEITFAENSAALAPSDQAAIEEAVARRKESGGNLRVVGYAGSGGSGDAAAQQLAGFGMALDRANAVARALAAAGAPSGSILVEAAPPVAGNGATARRAQIFVEP